MLTVLVDISFRANEFAYTGMVTQWGDGSFTLGMFILPF